MAGARKYCTMLCLVLSMLRNEEKLSVDPHLESDYRHQNLVTSRGSALAHAYQVWSTSITAFESHFANRRTHGHTGVITCLASVQRRTGNR